MQSKVGVPLLVSICFRFKDRSSRWTPSFTNLYIYCPGKGCFQGMFFSSFLEEYMNTRGWRGSYNLLLPGCYKRIPHLFRDEFIFYSERLMRILIEDSLNSMPYQDVEVETSPYHRFTFTIVAFLNKNKPSRFSIHFSNNSVRKRHRILLKRKRRGWNIGKLLTGKKRSNI